jgi:hypothetical protein
MATKTNKDPRQALMVNAGQERPTKANAGRQGPTVAKTTYHVVWALRYFFNILIFLILTFICVYRFIHTMTGYDT